MKPWITHRIKGLFEFTVSITHNSKIMGPITEKSALILFPVFISITKFSDFLVISYGNWKHINFHTPVFNDIFIIKLTTLSLFSRNVWLSGFFYKQSPAAYLDFSVFFFFFETKGRTEWWLPNRWVWRYWDILSNEWRKLSEKWG